MVEVIFFGSINEPKALLIKGHANFSNYGMDVVCAEISLISQNILISLIKVLENYVTYDIKNGFLAFDISDDLNEDQKNISFKLIKILINSLSLTEKRFPENLKISFDRKDSKEYKKFKKSLKQMKKSDTESTKLLEDSRIEVSLKKNFLKIKGNVDIGNYKNGILNAAMTAFVTMIKGSKDEFDLNLSEKNINGMYELKILSDHSEYYLLMDMIKEGFRNLNKQYPKNLIFDEEEV